MENKGKSASDVLEDVVNKNKGDYISLFEIKSALHERGFGIIMLIFALPLSMPLPLPPGFTAIPGTPLFLFSIQMMLGMDSPWLPKWVGNKTIKRSTLAFLIEKAAPYLRKAEKLLHPRFFFVSSTFGEKIAGFFCVLFSISILIPLPLTNMIPAIGITMMSLGLISKDGIVIILGIIVGNIGLMITTLVLFLGQKAATNLIIDIFQ